MDSGEWPSDWMFYISNNSVLGFFALLWLVGIAVLVAMYLRPRA